MQRGGPAARVDDGGVRARGAEAAEAHGEHVEAAQRRRARAPAICTELYHNPLDFSLSLLGLKASRRKWICLYINALSERGL